MLTYNYVEYAYPALDKVAYAVTLQQLYAQLDSEQITHQQFINLLKAANRCRETVSSRVFFKTAIFRAVRILR